MPNDLLFSFREDVSWKEGPERTFLIEGAGRKITLSDSNGAMRAVLKLLSSTGGTQEQLADLAFHENENAGVSNFYYCLSNLDRRGMISRSVTFDGTRLATLRPSSGNYRPSSDFAGLDRKYRLSRFAYCHRLEHLLVLESPLSHSRILLHDCRATTILTNLTSSRTAAELSAMVADLDQETALLFLSLLLQGRMIFDEQDAEEEKPALLQWDFHDLLFHSRSRKGRNDGPCGGTLRFLGILEPLPAVKPVMPGDLVPLFTPDLERFQKEDPPFAYVVETRRSDRSYDEENPITDRQLGEFLFRVGRIKKITPADSTKGFLYEVATRPYPAGGACYELELYLTIHRCNHIDPGLYYYQSQNHKLCKLSNPNEFTEALLVDARRSTGMTNLQVLITIAARFQRISWKYEAMAYAIILKHVGVLYQTMYLTATAMGLAACGIGGGDSDLFCRAAGTDYNSETSVGEFLIGSKPRSFG